MTSISLGTSVSAPIHEVLAFFDDPDNTLEFAEHAERFEVVDVQPDGRRTIEVLMKAGRRSWTQTIEQVLREPPTRLTTRGTTWSQRNRPGLTLTTDRLFSVADDGTRVDVRVDVRAHTLFAKVLTWLQRDLTRRELERQLSLMAQRLATRRTVQP